ncbi:MAG: M3 family metallopeptidase [Bacteroidetes bacterium]|nr:M3 family metallopeptidase [Bacteroidota bacterium]
MKILLILTVLALTISSCNTNQKKMTSEEINPFFSEFGTPFEVPAFDKIKTIHFMPAILEAIKKHSEEIGTIVNNPELPTFENTIEAKERSGSLLTRVSNVFYNLTGTNTNDELQKIAQDLAPVLSAHYDNIKLNKELFIRVKTVYENKENLNLNPEQQMLLEKTYRDFVRGGANLNEDDQEILRKVNQELAVMTTKFGDNLLAETNDFKLVIDNEADLTGLPEFVRETGRGDAKAAGLEGKWLFTLDKPSLIPFLQYSSKRDLRKKIFMGYINMGNNNNDHDNKSIASRIAALRVRKANLLGFKTWAHFVLEENMAKTPEMVYELMNQVWNAAQIKAREEKTELEKMMEADGVSGKLEAWDWWYYAEKLRKQKYDLNDEILKPYFELFSVRQGMFDVANKLFGLTFKERFDIPKPHEDAFVFEVFDDDGTHQAILFMDFFPRASKKSGAWMSSYRDQSKINGKNITPIITMVMNFSKPIGDTPSLLTFEEVSTLFHEFGHALHGMLSDCTYEMLSGTSVSRDFVELPSQIMENWVGEPEVLQSFAKHYKTGEPIPENLFKKIKASQHFNQGFATVEFTAAAFLDMSWHTITDTVVRETLSFESGELNKIGLMPEIVVRYRTPYFSHIFAGGYSAGYYSYQWAEVLDADAFEAFREKGLFDKATATSFRKNILEKGGTEDPMKLYIQFRGADPKSEPMLKRKGLN